MNYKKLVIFFAYLTSLSCYTSELLKSDNISLKEKNSSLIIKLMLNEHINAKDELVNNNYDINSPASQEDQTLLMVGASFGRKEFVSKVIENRNQFKNEFEIDLQDNKGRTVLMNVCYGTKSKAKSEVIRSLAYLGADPTKKEKSGKSFFDTSIGKKNKKYVQFSAQGWWNPTVFACKKNDLPNDIIKEISYFVYENPKEIGLNFLENEESEELSNLNIDYIYSIVR